MLETQFTDAELLQRVENLFAETRAGQTRGLDQLRAEFRAELTLVKQRLSRPPGAAPIEPNAGDIFRRRPSAGLRENSQFAEFITSSTKTRRSSFACELPFEIKAV